MRKFIPLIILVIAATVLYASGLYKSLSLETLQTQHSQLEAFIRENYSLSLLSFLLIYIGTVSLSLPGATILTVSAGYLFSYLVGTITVVLAASIGATIIFFSVKLASADFINKISNKWVKKMQAGFNQDAWSYLLTLRLIPLFPFFAINLLSGILQIPTRTYVTATMLGIIPGTAVYISVGVAAREALTANQLDLSLALNPKILLAFTGLGLLALLPVVWRKLRAKT